MASKDEPVLDRARVAPDGERVGAARRSLVSAILSTTGGRTGPRCGRCGSPNQVPVPITPGDHSHIVVGGELLKPVSVACPIMADHH